MHLWTEIVSLSAFSTMLSNLNKELIISKKNSTKDLATEVHLPFLDNLKTSLKYEVAGRFGQFLTGVQKYRAYPRQPAQKRPPPFWQKGATQVHQCGLSGPPVLIVPSLINRGDILDLSPSHSFVRTLSREGLRVFWIDWGKPKDDELAFGISDYVLKRLSPAAEKIHLTTGRPLVIVGYCMGGLLALGLVACQPNICCAYSALATPWDFHAPSTLKKAADHFSKFFMTAAEHIGFLPEDFLHALFSSLTPGLVAQKFRWFSTIPHPSPQADIFVTVEDWLNDGIPLTTRVLRECLQCWYHENATLHAKWSIANTLVSPAHITVPSFIVLSTRDRLIPPESSYALAQALPNSETINVDLGHIGMMIGRHAHDKVHTPLKNWITSITKN